MSEEVTKVLYVGNKPEKARKEDAAFDLRAAHSGLVPPGGRLLVRTGTQVALPVGMAALVMPRSGLALKFGVTVLNAPGLVDPDYIGDIGVILYNTGREAFFFDEGDRIAQLLLITPTDAKFTKTQQALNSSVRGVDGFGSSGVA